MMGTINTSGTSVIPTTLHDATAQKTSIFILAAVSTCSHTSFHVKIINI
jgi:hypothetical protein